MQREQKVLRFHTFQTDIRIAAVCLIVFIVIVAVTRYVSLGSLVISVLFLVGLVVDGQMGMFGMAQKYLFEMYGIGALPQNLYTAKGAVKYLRETVRKFRGPPELRSRI